MKLLGANNTRLRARKKNYIDVTWYPKVQFIDPEYKIGNHEHLT
jgi:hypothetical protein